MKLGDNKTILESIIEKQGILDNFFNMTERTFFFFATKNQKDYYQLAKMNGFDQESLFFIMNSIEIDDSKFDKYLSNFTGTREDANAENGIIKEIHHVNVREEEKKSGGLF